MRFHEFVEDLARRYGMEAAGARHEVFFITQRRSRLPARMRALLAGLRDAWLCLRLPPATPLAAGVVGIASLPGSSGLAALGPALRALSGRGIAQVLVVHPRLRDASGHRVPARPAGRAWRHALAAFRIRFAAQGAEAFIVRCCLFRLRLWRGAWQATLSGRERGCIVLHNDFELFSVAAIEAGEGRWDSLCVQHGLPTDEFFPTRARLQLVWGETSRAAYAGRGTAPEALRFGPARTLTPRRPEAPAAIRLVSQTHTPVFGRSLATDFVELAASLVERFPEPERFAILLHPEEVRLGHPYGTGRLAAFCRRPPHAELGTGAHPALIVGFCSTALIEAACRGHLVIGMDWDVPLSQAALAVGRPLLTVPDAGALGDLVTRLLAHHESFAEAMSRQEEWLQRTFVADEAWLAEFDQWR
jgi:hypothetical protein